MSLQKYTIIFLLLWRIDVLAQNVPCSESNHGVYVKLDNGYQGSISAHGGKKRLEIVFSTLHFCTEKDSHILIIFTDNTSISIDKINGFGCTSCFYYLYRRKDRALIQALATKKIRMFKVYGVDTNVTGILSPSESNLLASSIECLSREMN